VWEVPLVWARRGTVDTGQYPHSLALPALIPVVHHSFLAPWPWVCVGRGVAHESGAATGFVLTGEELGEGAPTPGKVCVFFFLSASHFLPVVCVVFVAFTDCAPFPAAAPTL